MKSRREGSRVKAILTDCSGVLEYSRITAVMGASGAGKTSLLNVLVRSRAARRYSYSQPTDAAPALPPPPFEAAGALRPSHLPPSNPLAWGDIIRVSGNKTASAWTQSLRRAVPPLTVALLASSAATDLDPLLAPHPPGPQAGFTKAQEAVSGTISVNGQQLVGHQMRRISGFVHQEVGGAGRGGVGRGGGRGRGARSWAPAAAAAQQTRHAHAAPTTRGRLNGRHTCTWAALHPVQSLSVPVLAPYGMHSPIYTDAVSMRLPALQYPLSLTRSHPLPPPRPLLCWPQDVILQTMTVREALLFAAMLRLPSAMPGGTRAQSQQHAAPLPARLLPPPARGSRSAHAAGLPLTTPLPRPRAPPAPLVCNSFGPIHTFTL